MKKQKIYIFRFVFFDYISALLAWMLFFFYRKIFIEKLPFEKFLDFFDKNFFLGVSFIPIFWLILYYFTATYSNIYRKARLHELWNTLIVTFFGVIIIFFELIIDDFIKTYEDYYRSVFALFLIHFSLTYTPRIILTNRIRKKIQKGSIFFNTLIVGVNTEIIKVFNTLKKLEHLTGNRAIGYVTLNNQDISPEYDNFNRVCDFENLTSFILEKDIHEVFIAIESDKHEHLKVILDKLILTNVKIKLLPSLFDLIYTWTNVDTVYDTLFLEIKNTYLSEYQENLKRVIDIVISLIAIIILIPVYIFVAIGVKISSKGPIFYLQERIGKNFKPFKIIKFRTMYVDAEKNGPQLSSKNDPRVTPFGRFLRKMRLDEIPQFFNVLIGNMSIVGPRPERKYYIDQIVQRAPYYYALLKVKPGITSLGQVKYGYAENVDQMIERLQYDIAYLKNISLYLDFKIMLLTIKTILEAKGK